MPDRDLRIRVTARPAASLAHGGVLGTRLKQVLKAPVAAPLRRLA